MRVQDALIAWNGVFGIPYLDDPTSLLPRVRVVEATKPFPAGWSTGYRSKWGACAFDWRNMNDAEASLEILLMFRRLVLQRIPAIDVHRAFFEIEGYRRAGGWDMSWNGDDFNP